MELITRAQAKERGLKRYFTGKPCPQGHVAERTTSKSACITCQRDSFKSWKENNRDRRLEYQRKHQAKYRQDNLDAYNAYMLARHHLRRAAALPGYEAEIREIYRNCPEGHEVDHIVPIKGMNVSGLHVPWNLQYLPVAENRAKGNKFKDAEAA